MRKPEEIKDIIFSKEYVVEHGVNKETLSDEYYVDDDHNWHYGEMFDKPMEEGGKPFTGIAYEMTDIGIYFGYTEYKDGRQNGADVSLYASGQLKSFSYAGSGEIEYYYGWHENGVLMAITDHNRKDDRRYYRSKIFDETGRLVKQSVKCEMNFEYDYDSPDPKYKVSWHENGEFRSVSDTDPQKGSLYAGIELDEEGYPVRFFVNPNYSAVYYSDPESYIAFDREIKKFDDTFRFEGESLFCLYSSGWQPFSKKVSFCNDEGRIEKILEYDRGLPNGLQVFYYPNGELRELYYISKGVEYDRHIWWHENGVIRRVLIYPRNGVGGYDAEFDKSGKLLKER